MSKKMYLIDFVLKETIEKRVEKLKVKKLRTFRPKIQRPFVSDLSFGVQILSTLACSSHSLFGSSRLL